MYWREYSNKKPTLDKFLSWLIETSKETTKEKEVDILINKAIAALNDLQIEFSKQAKARLIEESPEESQTEIDNCPWKDHKYGKCHSCEVRVNLIQKNILYNSYDPHNHNFATCLTVPEYDNNTGRQ